MGNSVSSTLSRRSIEARPEEGVQPEQRQEHPTPEPPSTVTLPQWTPRRGRRRKAQPEPSTAAPTVKRARLNTPQYLHQRLFLEGNKSDVQIRALGHCWRLHKIYLEQCDYFAALFNGSWADSRRHVYDLDLVDERITFKGLNNVFAALYQNEIEIDVESVGSVLAAASMFSLMTVIDKCDEIMTETVSADNVLDFLELATVYGCPRTQERIMQLLSRMFWKYSQNPLFLKQLKYHDLVEICGQRELCVCEGEKDLYTAIKKWIYIHHTQSVDFTENDLHEFFHEQPPAAMYRHADVLQHIRLQHMIISKRTLERVKYDHLVTDKMVDEVMRDLWNVLLIAEDRQDLSDQIDDEFFYRHCRRLGRHLDDAEKCWRWAGYDFGLDLVVRSQNGTVYLIRNYSRDHGLYQLSVKKTIKIHYRLLILDRNGQVINDSSRKVCELTLDQKEIVCNIDNSLRDISFHLFYMATMPGPSSEHYWTNIKSDSA